MKHTEGDGSDKIAYLAMEFHVGINVNKSVYTCEGISSVNIACVYI